MRIWNEIVGSVMMLCLVAIITTAAKPGVALGGKAVQTNSRPAKAQAAISIPVEIESGAPGEHINPLLFGHNLEVTRTAVWKGMGAEMVANRKFAAVDTDHLPKRWAVIGSASGTTSIDNKEGYAGSNSVRVQVRDGKKGGLAQEQDVLAFRVSKRYRVRLWLKSDEQREVAMRITQVPSGKIVFEKMWTTGRGNWELLTNEFSSPMTSERNRMEIFSSTNGVFHIGAVSIQAADAFNGMRRDVIEKLKSLQPGSLRWPGGCYAEVYRWREGLLPVDQRPPIFSSLHLLLPDNDGWDPHEIGIDEFIMLCREIGAEPAITVRMSDVGPEDGAALVEYCNGSPQTQWGKVRAERGHTKPHGVKYWFIGNEIWGWGVKVASERTEQFAQAMKKVDPGIVLIGCGSGEGWNRTMMERGGNQVAWYSLHNYYGKDARSGANGARSALQNFTTAFGKIPAGRPFGITYDEWNIFWGTSSSMAMAQTAAGTLSLLCREAGPLQAKAAYFFQPVNEGAIEVKPLSVKMEPVGEVFKLFANHKGNRLLKTTGITDEGDLDLCVSIRPGNEKIVITAINRNELHERAFALKIRDFGETVENQMTMLVPRKVNLPAGRPSIRRSWGAKLEETYTPVTTLDEFQRIEEPVRLHKADSINASLPPGAITCIVVSRNNQRQDEAQLR